jgi:hypothetical protein
MNCARCGHPDTDHQPPKSFGYAKTGGSSGKSHEVPIQARACCWSNPMCTCVEFVESATEGGAQ